jgi:hypothetical protein
MVGKFIVKNNTGAAVPTGGTDPLAKIMDARAGIWNFPDYAIHKKKIEDGCTA